MAVKIHPDEYPSIRKRIAGGETKVSVAASYRVTARALRHILSGTVRGLRYPTPKNYQDLLRQTVETENGCLEWAGAMRGNYGTVCVGGIRQPVHRLAWEYEYGSSAYEKYVCHRCQNYKCINIKHLYLSDVNENNRCRRSGSQHHNAKLDESKALRIYRRAVFGDEKWAAIANDECISPVTVSSIAHRKTWKRIHKNLTFHSGALLRPLTRIPVFIDPLEPLPGSFQLRDYGVRDTKDGAGF